MNIFTEKYIKKHEGFRQFVYKCPSGKLTIGYGRNLENRGITIEEAEYLIRNDISDLEKRLKEKIDFWIKIIGFRLSLK